MQRRFTSTSVVPVALWTMAAVACVWFTVSGCTSAGAGAKSSALDSIPLDPQAKLLQPEQTITMEPDGAAISDLFAPGRGFFVVDFAIPPGKTIQLKIMTGEQYRQLANGQKPSGMPLVNIPIEGTASQSTELTRGAYAIGFINKNPEPVSVVYRGSFKLIPSP